MGSEIDKIRNKKLFAKSFHCVDIFQDVFNGLGQGINISIW
jgi:hypothetical protein